jgi:hypothetical protein
MYNTALVKFIVMIIFTFLLNILCQRGLTVISWFIVFIPFITMTIITTLLLIVFGLSPFSGNMGANNMGANNIKPLEKCKDNTEQHHDKFYN